MRKGEGELEYYSTPYGGLVFERGLGGGQTGDRKSERRAGDIGQTQVMTEFYRIRFATVFAANTQFDILASGTTQFHCSFH